MFSKLKDDEFIGFVFDRSVGVFIFYMALVHCYRDCGLYFFVMTIISLYKWSGIVGNICLNADRMRRMLNDVCLFIRDYFRYLLWAYSMMQCKVRYSSRFMGCYIC